MIFPLKFSFNLDRTIAAPQVPAAIQLCPQACPGTLSGPYPGRASYSARNAIVGPSPQENSALNAVGRSQ